MKLVIKRFSLIRGTLLLCCALSKCGGKSVNFVFEIDENNDDNQGPTIPQHSELE